LQRLGEIAHHLSQFLFARLLFFLRGHLARVELIEDVLPVQRIGVIGDGTRQAFEVEVGLGRIRIMAAVAVGFEEGFDRGGGRNDRVSDCRFADERDKNAYSKSECFKGVSYIPFSEPNGLTSY
jgi:hypothetical protein